MGLAYRTVPPVFLVQDQDLYIVDADQANLTITVMGAAEKDGVKHVTDVHVLQKACRKSR
jgi:hypothetical protein